MATLENVHGASLVPSFDSGLNMLNQSFGGMMDRKRAQQAQQAQQQQIQQILGGGQGGVPGATTGFNGNATPQQILRIAQIDPKMAEMMQGMVERGDKLEMEQAKAQTDRGLREAVLIKNAKTPAERVNVINNLAAAAANEGKPIDQYVQLANMSPDQQELELQRMEVMGADIKTLLAPPKPPEIREVKRGDRIVTEQFNPQTGQFEQIADAQRFNPNSGNNISVNVNSGGEEVEREEIAKVDARQYGSVLERADSSQEILDNLSQFELIDVETGALEPAKVGLAAIVEGFGVDASGIANVSNAEAFNAVSNTLVNKVLNAAKGPQTDQDAARAKQTIANLGDTPAGAKFKINAMKALAMRDVEMAEFIQDKMDNQRANGEMVSFSKARTEWNNFKRETPLLSSAVKNPSTGLPVFFYEFKENAQRKRPGITEQEVLEAWRKVND